MEEIKSMAYLQGFSLYFRKPIRRTKIKEFIVQAYEEFPHGPLAVQASILEISY